MDYSDYIDKKFGKWTVLSFAKKTDKTVFFTCRCECGTEREISSYKLKNGASKSCGCSRQKDVTNKKFGKLTFVEKIGKTKNNLVIWKCQCECGNIIERTYASIVSKNICSCGCLAKENAREMIISNSSKLERVENTCINNLKQKISKNNKSGVKGVSWDAKRHKWVAQITFKRKNYNLGRYDRIEDAIKARKDAEEEVFGNFIRWNEERKKIKKTDEQQ